MSHLGMQAPKINWKTLVAVVNPTGHSLDYLLLGHIVQNLQDQVVYFAFAILGFVEKNYGRSQDYINNNKALYPKQSPQQIAYPNVLGTKRLCCCCCCIVKQANVTTIYTLQEMPNILIKGTKNYMLGACLAGAVICGAVEHVIVMKNIHLFLL
ncbi:hypothetical protein ACJX0J_036413 [Zea mays]